MRRVDMEEAMSNNRRDRIEEIIREGYEPKYDPELSLKLNGFDSLDIAELRIELENEFEIDVELTVNDLNAEMNLDFIAKVIEQKLQ